MGNIPDRLVAALADRYTIERELGAGGMATVYLAEDLKHKRKVAVKVLRPELAAVLGAERFVQEIKTTANLQHPHILPLFDSGEEDGFLYYVMPFIDGETLRDKLDRETQLGVEEAVKVTTDIADALDYAHRAGVVHRDIKPENILLHDGRPMVADFGIALALSAAAGGRMTETGLSLGTPHYMSPEQATAEKEITARSDVYSLGSVLYEMLTGEPPHMGNSAQAIIMKIVTEEAQPVTRLRKSVPPNVAEATATALEKLPADRFESAAKFAEALRDPNYASAASSSSFATSPTRAGNRLTIAMTVVAALLAVVAWRAIATRPKAVPGQVLRTTIGLSDSVRLPSPTFGSRVAISNDGSRIVFVGGGGQRQLWLRMRDRLEAVPLPGTGGAHAPFFSPDGMRVGFFTVEPPALKVVSLDGGLPVTIADSGLYANSSLLSAGATWGMDGSIYAGYLSGVVRIPQSGGSWTPVSTSDSTTDEKGHTPTDVLPNGRGLIIRVAHTPNTMESLYEVAALDLRTGTHRVLARGVYARYVPPGYLVFARADGVLMAAPFDQDRLELIGPEVTLGSGTDGGGFREFALTGDGALVYVDRVGAEETSELIWVRRDGSTEALDPSWRANFESASVSPDGTQLAAGLLTREGAEVWIAQLPRGPRYRLTVDGPISYRPTWLSDGQTVVFRSLSESTGRFELFAKRADGIGEQERLAFDARSISTGFVSPDGQWRIYRTDATEAGRGDILAMRAGDTVVMPLVATTAEERFPALSPDGRWLAYRSDVGGSHDVWVRPFPNVADGRWQVSAGGGSEPVWSRSGRELFFITPDNELVAASVTTEPTFAVRERRVLFRRPATTLRHIAIAAYDVTPDDQQFVMIRSVSGRVVGPMIGVEERIVFVENWIEELRERVGR